MPDWPDTATAVAEAADLHAEVQQLRATLSLVTESYADLSTSISAQAAGILRRDERGWRGVGQVDGALSAEARAQAAALADLAVTSNALIKAGVNIRTAYIWGGGVTVGIKDDGDTGQDVGAVWKAFWDDATNRRVLTTTEAQTRYERRLATGGEAFFALPTNPATGKVVVRRIPAQQITERVCDPEDAETVWLYKRVWSAVNVDGTADARTEYYPALGFNPAGPKVLRWNKHEIRWDAPVRHVAVNVPDEDWRGIGDAFAAVPWARADKEFLEDLATYMRALTKILGQVQAPNSRAAQAAQRAVAGSNAEPGALVATDAATTLSLVSKSGAQIDGDSHRPLATMVAAALEVPLTMLLGDPGQTGARAVAETLDQPTELKFGLRRDVHAELFRDIAGYVIDQAVLAKGGSLRGTQRREGDRIVVDLPEGDDRTVEVTWPEYDSLPLKDLIEAIAAAAAVEPGGLIDPVVLMRLILRAFEVENVDELIDQATDDDGNWLGQLTKAEEAALRRRRQGEGVDY